MSMKESIFEMILRKKAVSFYELEESIDGFYGDQAWGVPEKNMFFWTRLSVEAGAALQELIDEKLIKMTPSSVLVYQIDGFVTTMQVAKEITAYKTPRWFPVVFNPILQ
jgi:hypothetical protein